MMNIFRNLFTGKDNVTHDLGRWSWAGSFLTLVAGLGVNAWHHALIDLTALAAALGVIAGAHSAALWAKRDTEPGPK